MRGASNVVEHVNVKGSGGAGDFEVLVDCPGKRVFVVCEPIILGLQTVLYQ